MSHIAKCKTGLRNINPRLMGIALAEVARLNSGTFNLEGASVTDYYGQRTACTMAVYTDKMKRGIGININSDGTIDFVCDGFMLEQEVTRLKGLIVQCYNSTSVLQQLQEMGYQVDYTRTEEGVHIQGMRY